MQNQFSRLQILQFKRLFEAGLFLLLALLFGHLLAGCGTNPAEGGASGRGDLLTESDESDNRKRAKLRLELAVGYFEQGKTTIALDELKQAISTDPSFADAYNLRGLIYMRLSDNQLAEESFKRALTLVPGNPNILHNYGWLLCQQAKYVQSEPFLAQAIAAPGYGGRAKSLMAQGLCQQRAGKLVEAEQSLQRGYELDPGNPIIGYNLALSLFNRGELQRSQFIVRRINNSELANAESLWLGVKVEQRLNNPVALTQLGEQLRKRFPQSRELVALDRGAFNE